MGTTFSCNTMSTHCIILSLYLFTCTLSEILWQSLYSSNDNTGWSNSAGNSPTYGSYYSACPYGNNCWRICGSQWSASTNVFTRSSVSTVGYTNTRLTFDINTNDISNFDINEYCKLQWSDNSWSSTHDIGSFDDGDSAKSSHTVSGSAFTGADNEANLEIRIYFKAGWGTSDCCYFSRFILQADPIPTPNPTHNPTHNPTTSTNNPSISPTQLPSIPPTHNPTHKPTISPIDSTQTPSIPPTKYPTASPSFNPSISPTQFPTTSNPSASPTKYPTVWPTFDPTAAQGAAGEQTTQNIDEFYDNNKQKLEHSPKSYSSLFLYTGIGIAIGVLFMILILYIIWRKKRESNKFVNKNMDVSISNTNNVNHNIEMEKIISTSNVLAAVSVMNSPSSDDDREYQFAKTLTHVSNANTLLDVMDDVIDVINDVNGVTDNGFNETNNVLSEQCNVNEENSVDVIDDDNDDDDEILMGINSYKTKKGPLHKNANIAHEGMDTLVVINDVFVANDEYQKQEIDNDNDIGPHTLK